MQAEVRGEEQNIYGGFTKAERRMVFIMVDEYVDGEVDEM